MATYKIVSHGGNGLPLNVETTSTISERILNTTEFR